MRYLLVIELNTNITPTLCNGQAKDWCDRNFGIGADGVIVMHPSAVRRARHPVVVLHGNTASVRWYRMHATRMAMRTVCEARPCPDHSPRLPWKCFQLRLPPPLVPYLGKYL